MNKKTLSKQEERELLALQCEVARLKVQMAQQCVQQHHATHAHHFINATQIANDVLHNPLWRILLRHGGKQKWWLGAILLIWQMSFAKK